MLRFKDADAASGVSGLVRSRNGDVWLNGSRGIGRIPYAELEAGLADPKHEIVTESITEGDYVGPAPFQLRLRTAFVDGNGTLWFIAPDGTPLHLDPEHIGSPLPQLSILNMVSDGVPVSPANVIPPKPNTLLIRYFGVDLAVPDKITYRYKLDGVDPAWQEVGRRTEAVYTRLRPGQYTFHVQASNGSGDWTPITSGVPFTVSPSFYQTGWFGASCLAVGLLLSWLLLHLRVQYVASQLNVRFDERLAERTRIARELHDTLLQGFQGLTLHFQGVMKQIPDELPARETMRKALGYADEVLTEARKRVRDLRAEGPISGDLSQDLTSYGEELARDKAVEFKITVVGTPQPLHPVAGDEIHRITREALANAFRHSQASSIEVEMTYEPAGFSLRVRDNGVGIDQEILNSGRQGHWGLSGMRERAQEVGGDWRIWSSAGKGTEIHLKVPARCAYVSREKVKRAGI